MENIFTLLLCLTLQYGAMENCQLNTTLQSDFDFGKFMGLWYEVSSYTLETASERLLADTEHQCVQTSSGAATMYSQGRTSPTSPCSMSLSNLTTTEERGRLLFETIHESYELWVVDTDYSDYAFVYGCYNVSTSGLCSGARAWTWSRSQSLSQSALDRTAHFYQNTCLQEAAFETVVFNQSCSVKTHWNIWEGQDCNVSNIAVQDNFDMIQYFSGTWYEMKWLSSVVYPYEELFQDYLHQYVITRDGNAFGYSYGRSPANNKCFHEASILEITATPGKQIYRPFKGRSSPYWVLKTDYTQYAVVYGCYNENSDGSCNKARSWVWSRTPTLPDQLQYQANRILQSVCVNPSAFLPTDQNELCDSKPIWNIGNKQNCNFTRVANVVQGDFSSEEFTRVWYEFSVVSSARADVTDSRLEVFFNANGDMTIYSRFRKGSTCKYTSATYRKTGPATFRSQSTGDEFDLWVAGTDYSSYAVLYTCERVGSDGGCESARGSVWSRSPTLSLQHQYTINSLLQDLCLNPSALIKTPQTDDCKPQEMKPSCPATSDAASLCESVTFLVSMLYCLVYNM